MKKILISAVMLFAAIAAHSQNQPKGYTRDGKTFTQTKGARSSSSSDMATAYTWKDGKGNEYPLFLHTYTKGEKAGRTTCYVLKTSAKTGKEYKYYVPNGEAIAAEILGETNSNNINSKSI